VIVSRRQDPASGAAFAVELITADGEVAVRLHGELDLAVAESLTTLLRTVQDVNAPFTVDLSDVVFLDTTGVAPLVELARDRHDQLLPPVRIGACSTQVRRVLDLTGLRGAPDLDVRAWDELAVAATACWQDKLAGRRRGRTRDQGIVSGCC
jgi:anti-sigma B factor antagonist